jgi:hypothetical protein
LAASNVLRTDWVYDTSSLAAGIARQWTVASVVFGKKSRPLE